MTWACIPSTYSPELAAESWQTHCSGTRRSAQSKSKSTREKFYSHDRLTEVYLDSLFGTTLKPSDTTTQKQGHTSSGSGRYPRNSSYPAGSLSPAKISAVQAKAKESKEPSPGSGLSSLGSLAKYDPDSSSWRTPQCSLLGDSDEFSETWPRWGSMRNGECWERTIPAHLTSGTESGSFLATATATAKANQLSPSMQKHPGVRNWIGTPTTRPRIRSEEFRDGRSLNPAELSARFPTPRSSDAERGGRGDLIQAVRGNPNSHFKLWPTPTARSAPDCPAERRRKTPALAAQVGGSLNPDWVEGLMGWPKGWSDIAKCCYAEAYDWMGGFRQDLPSLRSGIPQEARGVSGELQTPEVLQHPMFSAGDDHKYPDEGDSDVEGSEVPQRSLRGVRPSGSPSRSSCGPRPNEQHSREHPDALYPLPQVLARYGRAAWHSDSWEDGTPPIAQNIENRAARLRAIGNGQVPAVVRLAWETLTA